MAWRYKNEQDLTLFAKELERVSFKNEWLTIESGNVFIPKDYAWDGCSPTLKIPAGAVLPNGIWMGPWDGPLGIDCRPVTWKASLVHDALCQFRKEIYNLKKKDTVDLFGRLLLEANAPRWMCLIYPLAIDRYGPQYWHGDNDYATLLLQQLQSYDHVAPKQTLNKEPSDEHPVRSHQLD